MQTFNKNSSNYSNKRQYIVYNDKQTNKRTAGASSIAPVPVKKYITTTSNSNCMLQLKCNGNVKIQTKYIKNNLKRSNMFNTDIIPRIYPSNTTENFTGSFYLKYNNLNENMCVQRNQKINQDKHCYNNHNLKNVTNKNEDLVSLYSNQLLNTNSEFSNILYPNVPPSANMQRNMMQALEGILIISTEAIYNQYNVDITDLKLFIRPMKIMISDRIKKVLMGRTVGSTSDIIDCYLRRYPKDTDTELLALFKDRNNINNRLTYLIEADDPKQYYTVNMMRLINTKMKKIITVVEKIYENSEKQSNDCLNNGLSLGSSANGHDGSTETNYTILKSIFYDQSMSYAIESEFPKLLRKFKNEIVHMILGKETCQAIKTNLLPRSPSTRREKERRHGQLPHFT